MNPRNTQPATVRDTWPAWVKFAIGGARTKNQVWITFGVSVLFGAVGVVMLCLRLMLMGEFRPLTLILAVLFLGNAAAKLACVIWVSNNSEFPG